MEYRARIEYCNNSLYFHHHNHHLLLLHLLLSILLLASFPSTMANTVHPYPSSQGKVHQHQSLFGQQEDHHVTEQCAATSEHQTPPGCKCPSTLEPEAVKQLKVKLTPVIRHRLTELSLTVKSAIEAAHTLDLLKLLTESNSEHLDRICEEVHERARQLTDAFEKINQFI